jgi:hypothetical protein
LPSHQVAHSGWTVRKADGNVDGDDVQEPRLVEEIGGAAAHLGRDLSRHGIERENEPSGLTPVDTRYEGHVSQLVVLRFNQGMSCDGQVTATNDGLQGPQSITLEPTYLAG